MAHMLVWSSLENAICPVLVAHFCNPSYSGGKIRRIMVRSQPGQTVYETLFLKYPTQNRAKGVAQVLEQLCSKYDALSSNPSAAKKKKKKIPSAIPKAVIRSSLLFSVSPRNTTCEINPLKPYFSKESHLFPPSSTLLC
jgi:hypothetical protein